MKKKYHIVKNIVLKYRERDTFTPLDFSREVILYKLNRAKSPIDNGCDWQLSNRYYFKNFILPNFSEQYTELNNNTHEFFTGPILKTQSQKTANKLNNLFLANRFNKIKFLSEKKIKKLNHLEILINQWWQRHNINILNLNKETFAPLRTNDFKVNKSPFHWKDREFVNKRAKPLIRVGNTKTSYLALYRTSFYKRNFLENKYYNADKMNMDINLENKPLLSDVPKDKY